MVPLRSVCVCFTFVLGPFLVHATMHLSRVALQPGSALTPAGALQREIRERREREGPPRPRETRERDGPGPRERDGPWREAEANARPTKVTR